MNSDLFIWGNVILYVLGSFFIFRILIKRKPFLFSLISLLYLGASFLWFFSLSYLLIYLHNRGVYVELDLIEKGMYFLFYLMLIVAVITIIFAIYRSILNDLSKRSLKSKG
jgi:hypothetical protein